MKLGVVMPVFIRNDEILRLTYQTVDSIDTEANVKLKVILNSLTATSVGDFNNRLNDISQTEVELIDDGKRRCVSASWNFGVEKCIKEKCDLILLLGNDVKLEESTINILIDFGMDKRNHNVSAWSGINKRDRTKIDKDKIDYDAADFSCLMMRPESYVLHGRFDENFKPAYFEDNDYYARIVLSGHEVAAVHAASYFHYGSMTIKTDKELRNNNQGFFNNNKVYFGKKWGTENVARSKSDILRNYYKYPFNNNDVGLDWWN